MKSPKIGKSFKIDSYKTGAKRNKKISLKIPPTPTVTPKPTPQNPQPA